MTEQTDVRRSLVESLREYIRRDRFPSQGMLELLEEILHPEEWPDYLALLVEKLQQDRYPSLELAKRAARLARTAEMLDR